MKVRFKGDISQMGIIEVRMAEVVNDLATRLNIPEGTQVNICDVEFKAKFTIDGQEQFVTVSWTWMCLSRSCP